MTSIWDGCQHGGGGDTNSACYRGRQASLTFDPGPLTAALDYYWRVDVVMTNGEVVAGTVWRFTTAEAPLTAGLPVHLTFDKADLAGQNPETSWTPPTRPIISLTAPVSAASQATSARPSPERLQQLCPVAQRRLHPRQPGRNTVGVDQDDQRHQRAPISSRSRAPGCCNTRAAA